MNQEKHTSLEERARGVIVSLYSLWRDENPGCLLCSQTILFDDHVTASSSHDAPCKVLWLTQLFAMVCSYLALLAVLLLISMT